MTAFEPAGERLRAEVPATAKRRVLRSASVDLPAVANSSVHLEDDATHLAIDFTLEGASSARIETCAGVARYAGAWHGADVIQRAHAEGTEDFVVLEERPAEEELRYTVDVQRVAGLRLVSNVLEFLDEGGAPRLRVRPPYVVDESGVRTAATIAVDGCAYDTDGSGPWGRPVTKPGAQTCGVRVTWTGVTYPAIVDPSWVTTGSMATARDLHTATLLPSGKVLVAGGNNGTAALSSAELFDGTSSFAATGSLTTARYSHTATLLNSGKVLIAGGEAYPAYLSSAELFDGTGSFAVTGSMATGRAVHTATLLTSGKVLVAGGYNGAVNALSAAELFDGTSSFATTGSMTTTRMNHTATLLNSGKVLVTGGRQENGGSYGSASAELFDGASSFAATGTMTTARMNHTATLLDSGKVLVAGGWLASGTVTQAAELFDGIGSFAATSSMTTSRAFHTATLLSSGKVVVAGGANAGGTTLSSAELFDGSGAFAATGSMTTARGSHTATLLKSGQVLVAAGANTALLASAELFDLMQDGSPCTVADDCVSGICDVNCCSATCGVCQNCAAGTGACVAVTNASDPDTCTGTRSCDPTGACKTVVGSTCATGSDCVSTFCAEGVCCNQACVGGCESCNVTAGTCTVVAKGSAGNPSCSPYRCDGAGGQCPTVCATDGDCAAGFFCAADGSCQQRKAQGSSCNQTADCKVAGCLSCATGYCTDGVCCDKACQGAGYLCDACAAALKASGSDDGTCGPASNHTDPHNDCLPDPNYPGNCKADGMCDGTGSCRTIAAQGTVCGPATCTAGIVMGGVCDASGNCGTGMASCGLYACNNAGDACLSSCATDADCSTTAFCNSSTGTCALKGSTGGPCTTGTDCTSGNCFDGVCCDQPCGGVCQACNLAAKKGTCTPISGDPTLVGHPACPGDNACGGSCDGADTTTCHFPGAGTPCGNQATCTGDVATAAQACDGSGTCAPAVTRNCTPYACDVMSGDCKQSCQSSTDCAQGATCDTATNKCATAAGTCQDAFTVMTPDGILIACAPYRCANGACQSSCTLDADCATGNLCVANTCVSSAGSGAGGGSAEGPSASSGCKCGVVGNAERRLPPLAVLIPLFVAGRRRSFRRRGRST